MLPRISKLDREFIATVQTYIQAKARDDGLLREIKSHVIHEGQSSTISRKPDEVEFVKMTEGGAETLMEFSEIEIVDLAYILKKADEVAAQFGRHFAATLFEAMDGVTKQTGLRYDGGGKPLTVEGIIEALSLMHVNFDSAGNPTFSIVGSPGLVSRVAQLQAQFDSDPNLRKRWEMMMDMKRDEFRTREINRNLAG